ncbi:MAG: transcriptional regulator NrdR [Sphingomicrobium sp.]
MRCPFCAHEDSQVKDSRPSEDGAAIRRRRQCEACGARFTTFERVQLRDLTVVKKAGEREPFERDKLARSIAIACRKRDISADRIDRLISSIQRQLETRGDEVTTTQIGEAVMDALKAIDHVAYIRFASVYKDFTEPGDFAEIVEAVGEEARSEEPVAQPGKPQGSPDRLL